MSLNSKKSKKERLKFVTKRIHYRVHITSISPLSNLVIKSIFMDILTTYSTNIVVRPVLGFFFFYSSGLSEKRFAMFKHSVYV